MPDRVRPLLHRPGYCYRRSAGLGGVLTGIGEHGTVSIRGSNAAANRRHQNDRSSHEGVSIFSPQRTLFRGATVITMDPQLGVLPRGDVLVEGGVIVAVEPNLGAVDAEVLEVTDHLLCPGLIDTHRHTWQTQMRGLCADWTLADYVRAMRRSISPMYRPEDVGIGNMLGAAEALAAGVTTVLDYSHCINTPDYADAALEAWESSGARAVFAYGFFDSNPQNPQHFTSHAERIEDFRRVARRLPSSDGRVTIGAALTEIGQRPMAETRAEIEVARELEALIVCHTGCVWSAPSGVLELDGAGLLGPEQVHVHCNTLTDAEWQALARAGAKVSISPETELNMGMGRPVFAACRKHGLRPTLSCDIVSLNSGDLLAQLRAGIGFARWELADSVNAVGQDPTSVGILAGDALAWCTTNAADALGEVQLHRKYHSRQTCRSYRRRGTRSHPTSTARSRRINYFQTNYHDIQHVMVDGKFVKREGKLTKYDIGRLTRAAETSAAEIIDRVEAAQGPLQSLLGQGFAAIADERRSTFEQR